MPYILNKTARSKSEFYNNILEADEQEFLRIRQKELQRMQVSGSNTDGTFPIRDENGVLLSFQDPYSDDKTKSVDEPYQYVRLKLNQKSSDMQRFINFFGNEIEFGDIYPNYIDDEGDLDTGEDIEVLRAELNADIDRYNDLNTELQNAINNLTAKIASLNNQSASAPPPPPPPAPKPKPKKTKNVVKKTGRRLKKWFKKIFSDERLKRDIQFIGTENGFNTYEFRYIWGTQRYKGVMAQEVMKTKPQAVDKLFGIYRVDYDELGVEFIKC